MAKKSHFQDISQHSKTVNRTADPIIEQPGIPIKVKNIPTYICVMQARLHRAWIRVRCGRWRTGRELPVSNKHFKSTYIEIYGVYIFCAPPSYCSTLNNVKQRIYIRLEISCLFTEIYAETDTRCIFGYSGCILASYSTCYRYSSIECSLCIPRSGLYNPTTNVLPDYGYALRIKLTRLLTRLHQVGIYIYSTSLHLVKHRLCIDIYTSPDAGFLWMRHLKVI